MNHLNNSLKFEKSRRTLQRANGTNCRKRYIVPHTLKCHIMTGVYGMTDLNKIERQNTIRKLILGKTPSWLLFEALQKHVVKSGDNQVQPYKHVSFRTYERDLQEIKEEDRHFMNKMMGEEWNHQIRQSMEAIENDQREMFKLAQDAGTGNKEKADILAKHAELETMKLSVVMFGKTALIVSGNGEKLPDSKQSIPPVTV